MSSDRGGSQPRPQPPTSPYRRSSRRVSTRLGIGSERWRWTTSVRRWFGVQAASMAYGEVEYFGLWSRSPLAGRW